MRAADAHEGDGDVGEGAEEKGHGDLEGEARDEWAGRDAGVVTTAPPLSKPNENPLRLRGERGGSGYRCGRVGTDAARLRRVPVWAGSPGPDAP